MEGLIFFTKHWFFFLSHFIKLRGFLLMVHIYFYFQLFLSFSTRLKDFLLFDFTDFPPLSFTRLKNFSPSYKILSCKIPSYKLLSYKLLSYKHHV